MRAFVHGALGAIVVLTAVGALQSALLGHPDPGPPTHPLQAVGEESPASPMESEVVLEAGNVLILASWRCSYLQLERVNELGRAIVEPPLIRMAREGRVLGWGQLNGDLRAEYNYHTFYVARSLDDYRRALGAVMTHIHEERRSEMEEFYRLCDSTREVPLTVVTARR